MDQEKNTNIFSKILNDVPAVSKRIFSFKITSLLFYPVIFYTTICILSGNLCFAQSDSTKKILILNSYHKEFKWTDEQVSAAKEVLTEGIQDLELFVEYMDTKRIYNDEYLKHLHDVYNLKYRDVKLDAVITTDDNALWFVFKYHKELFGGAPVSFCGINDYNEQLLKGREQFTGIVEVLDIKATIDLALQLYPETRKVVTIVDSTPTGIGQLKDAREVSKQYSNLKFEFIEGKDYSHQELSAKLRSLPQGNIVLLTVWLRDKHDEYLSYIEGGQLISSNSTVPVFGIIDMYFGYGIVGGKLINSRTHGKIAAEKILQILSGKKPADIPVTFKSMNPYMFDYSQLKRWKIDLSDLPEGSIIINKPFSFYKEYKLQIWIIFSVIAFLILTVTVLAFNIIYRRKAEEALRDSEEKFRLTFYMSPDSVSLTRLKDGRILDVNRGFTKITGHLREDAVGKTSTDIKIWQETKGREHLVKELKENGYAENLEVKLLTQKGQIINGLLSARIVKLAGEDIIITITRDISEKLKREKELKEERDFIKYLMETSPVGVIRVDKQGEVIYANRRGEEIIGITPSKAGSKKYDDPSWEITDFEGGAFPEENLPFHIIKHTLKPVYNVQHAIKSPDGKKVFLSINASPLFDANGVFNGMVSTIEDITERIKSQKEKNKLEENLKQTQKMESIGNLAGGIAHDFNNILSPILLHSEMIMDDLPSNDPMQQDINEIYKAGKRAKDLVQQILTFARKRAEEKIILRSSLILKEAIKFLRSTIPTTINIQYSINTDQDRILADPTHLNQIIMNLCTNASHAMREKGGVLRVTLDNEDIVDEKINGLFGLKPGKYLKLSVKDTGKGISPEDMERIFEPYYTTKKIGEGTGLGLAIIHGIVQSYGGDINIESVVDKGTTFKVYLPLVETKISSALIQDGEIPKGTESILIVDDEIAILNALQKMLVRLGYNVTASTNVIEIMDIFRSDPNKFDLVITDMTMPKMTGKEFAIEIKKVRNDIPIIMCTGFSDNIDEKKAKEEGINAFIMKPINRSEMAKTIRKVLDKN